MSKGNVRKQVLERNKTLREKEKPSQSFISKHLKKVYPLGIQKSSSSQSLSSLSQNSNESSPNGPLSLVNRRSTGTTLSLRQLGPPERKEKSVSVVNVVQDCLDSDDGSFKRCHWITKKSDEVYVVFHDEHWGVPVYDDNQLFELLAFSGMLMYHLWTEILKKKEQYREAFAKFDPNVVAKMSEKEVKEIITNKTLGLAESQVRCIVDNAKCILKIMKEFGSFSNYLWGYMNYKPMINRYRYPKSVPLRSPKAEAISKDLQRRGCRFVGPVIVYAFMQAAGMTMDHLVDCFRFSECVSIADKSMGAWFHDCL